MPRQRAAHLPSSVLLVEQLVRATTAVVPIPTLWTDAYRTNGNQRWAVPAFDGDAVLEFIEHSEADLLLFEQALAVLRLLADGLPPSAIGKFMNPYASLLFSLTSWFRYGSAAPSRVRGCVHGGCDSVWSLNHGQPEAIHQQFVRGHGS